VEADLVVRNCRLYVPYTMEFIECDVYVSGGRVLAVDCGEGYRIACREELNAGGRPVVPGFIDAHFHVDSSMLAPWTLARALAARGTTCVVTDPHEVANVAGVEGVEWLMEACGSLPIRVYFQVPSCVPASPFEDPGAELSLEDQLRLAERGCIALGEVMDYVGLVSGDPRLSRLVSEARHRGLVIEGHCPGLSGLDLDRYVYAGVDSDHTKLTSGNALEKARKGVFLEVQEKSLTEDVVDLLCRLPPGSYCLVTDDVLPDKLARDGHLDHLVRLAVKLGLPIEKALYAVTLAPAARMGLRDLGAVAPGKAADLAVLEDLESLRARVVFCRGRLVYRRGGAPPVEAVSVPRRFLSTVHVAPLHEEDLAIRIGAKRGTAVVNVIGVEERSTLTRWLVREVPVRDGLLRWDETGLTLAAVVNRYGRGRRALGLLEGCRVEGGAAATTYAHDAHNLIIVGNSPRDMVAAAEKVAGMSGGVAVSVGGSIRCALPLPLMGIMSLDPLEKAAAAVAEIKEALRELGYRHTDPLKSLSTLTLTVAPELRLSTWGLVDVKRRRVVPLVVKVSEE